MAGVGGCGQVTDVVAPDPVAAALAEALPDDSIYQLETALETHAGATTTLAAFRGHPTIVSMFYANCPMACPMLIQEVQRLEGALSPEERAEVRVLLVSLDPARDTPELMAGVVTTHQLDAGRWTLARTDEASVREVAAVLGIQYRPLADGEMNHSSILTLVDRQGRIQARIDGLGHDHGPILEKLSGS